MRAMVQNLPRAGEASAGEQYNVPRQVNVAHTKQGLPEVAAEIRALVDGVNVNEMSALYKAAKLVRDTQSSGQYGDQVVEALAQQLHDLGLTAKTLMNYSRVATFFPAEDFEKLRKRTSGTDTTPFRMTWTHAMFFAEKGQCEGTPLVEKVFADCLNTKEARTAWVDLAGAKKKMTKGQKPGAIEAPDNDDQELKTGKGDLNTVIIEIESRMTEALVQLQALDNFSAPQLDELSSLNGVLRKVEALVGAIRVKTEQLFAEHHNQAVPVVGTGAVQSKGSIINSGDGCAASAPETFPPAGNISQGPDLEALGAGDLAAEERAATSCQGARQ